MEQDIKILEDFINKPVKSGEFNKISNKEIQAIENLLRRNCYLENEARKIINQELNKAQVDLYKNYIPILVIQNEIDKLGNMLQETMEGKIQKYTPGEIIFLKRFLENLLEERN